MTNDTNVVSFTTFQVTSQNVKAATDKAKQLLQRVAPTLQGFLEGTLLTNEDQTRIMLIARWESRDAWARAEWNQQVSEGVGEMYDETASYSLNLFHEIARASPSTSRT
jgi:heme-degrading monooxygenase HmoA